jgi:hypothetical protein
MILKDSEIIFDNEPCINDIDFTKSTKIVDNDLKIEYSRKFQNPITNSEILDDFAINKVSGEFGMIQSDLNNNGMNLISIVGICKRVNNAIN